MEFRICCVRPYYLTSQCNDCGQPIRKASPLAVTPVTLQVCTRITRVYVLCNIYQFADTDKTPPSLSYLGFSFVLSDRQDGKAVCDSDPS